MLLRYVVVCITPPIIESDALALDRMGTRTRVCARGRARPALLQRAGAFLPKTGIAPLLGWPLGDRDYPTRKDPEG